MHVHTHVCIQYIKLYLYRILCYEYLSRATFSTPLVFASQRQQRAEGDGIRLVARQGGLVQDDDPGSDEHNTSYDVMEKVMYVNI